jgi:hypothetical protein
MRRRISWILSPACESAETGACLLFDEVSDHVAWRLARSVDRVRRERSRQLGSSAKRRTNHPARDLCGRPVHASSAQSTACARAPAEATGADGELAYGGSIPAGGRRPLVTIQNSEPLRYAMGRSCATWPRAHIRGAAPLWAERVANERGRPAGAGHAEALRS